MIRVRTPWAMTLLLVAALGFTASYTGAVVPAGLVLAVAIPFGTVALGRRAGASATVAALITILLATAAAWSAVRRSSTGSLADALPRLLTTPRPARASAALLAPVLLLVVLVAAVVAGCVFATVRDRVAGLLAPVIGAAGLYVGAAVLAAGHSDPHGLLAVCLLVIAAAGWSLPHERGGGRAAWRPAAFVPLAVAAVVGLGLGVLSPASNAYDPRRHVTPPTVQIAATSPLTQLDTWTANPSVTILQARLTGTRRLHLATLTRFTGDSWQIDDRYRAVGLDAGPDLPAGARRATARATVRLVQLGGVWLPAPGLPSGTTAGDALVDIDTGTLAQPQQVHPGLTYDVTADVPEPTGTSLAVAGVPSGGAAQRYLDLPDLPAGFATYARAAVRGASTPLEEAVALEHAVSTGRHLDARAPTGSSYGRLQTFLFTPAGTAGAQVGTEEQFAASFAVLARAVGLPTRLVVGFLVPGASGSTSVVHGSDATVWPEVYFTGIGWVPFAPTPGDDGGSADASLRQTVLQRLSQQAAVLPVPRVRPPAATTPTTTVRPGPTPRAATPSGLPGWAVAAIVAGAVLLAAIGLVLALRWARTRRHRRRGPAGAWAEVLDVLVLAGRRVPVSRPAPEVALEAGLGERGLALARAADAAAFAPAGTDAPGTDVWRDVRVLRRRIRRTMPRRRRAVSALDPRPLRRR